MEWDETEQQDVDVRRDYKIVRDHLEAGSPPLVLEYF